MVEDALSKPIRGTLSREVFVRLFSEVHLGFKSGSLRVESGRHWRCSWWVAGAPVWHESNVPEEQLEASLVEAGLLTQAEVDEALGDRAQDESFREALLRRGHQSAAALHDHLRQSVARGATAALAWRTGEVSFKPMVALPATVLKSAVLSADTPLRALWAATQKNLSMGQVMEFVAEPDAGDIRPEAGAGAVLEALLSDGPLAPLVAALSEPVEIGALFGVVPQHSGEMMVLLWLLEHTGLVKRSRDRRAPLPDPDPAANRPLPAAAPEPRRSPPAPPGPRRSAPGASKPGRAMSRPGSRATAGATWPGSKALATSDQIAVAVKADYQKRMRRDYYAFLGLTPEAGVAVVQGRATKLLNRWMRALKSPRTPAPAKGQAEEMVGTVKLVWRTLSDPERRAEYDRRLARGQAPLAGGVRAANVSAIISGAHPTLKRRSEEPVAPRAADAQREAASAMEEGDYAKAAALLRVARQEKPSDPDVLAELGWCEWRSAGSDAQLRESAEEYIRLAVTFDSGHKRGLEYLARMAVDRKDATLARRRLRAFLAVEPDANWARIALHALDDGASSARG